MNEDEKKVCRQREAECKAESYSFNERLKWLGRANWITVLIPSLLVVVVGSALFTAGNEWKTIIGYSTLTAALLTAIHKGLNCDAYQLECSRLIQAYHELETRYRTLHEVPKKDWLDDFLKLETQLAEVREGARVNLLQKNQAKEAV
jgi:hypothetical protein